MQGKHIIYKNVEKYATLVSFPATGNTQLLYLDIATNILYTWNGASYSPVASGGAGADLATTLGVGNITGANDISMNTGQSLVSGNGTARLDLDAFTTANSVYMTTGAGATIPADFYLDDAYIELTLSGGSDGILLEESGGDYNVTVSTNTSGTLTLRTDDMTWRVPSVSLNYNWDTSNLTGSSKTLTLPNASGTVALTSDITSGLVTKSGTQGTFAGNPKKATVTFSTAFADANYTPTVVGQGGDNYTITVESIVAGSFVINLNSNIAPSNDVLWTAIKHGES